MKRLIFSFLLLGACTYAALAQVNADEKGDRVKAYRIAVFTEILRLTPEEAQGFWPVYNEFIDKREDLHKQMKPDTQLDGMSDAEVEDYIKKHFEMKQREIDLEKDMVQKLRKVLPPRKIAKIPVAEREFREALIKKLQEKRDQRMERRGAVPPRGRN